MVFPVYSNFNSFIMKKIFLSFILLFSFLTTITACDICGCGGGNFYLGLMPQFKNKFIGIRYHYAQFHTVLASDPSQFSHNAYHSAELWGGWNIGSRWQVLAFVPYYFNHQADDDGLSNKNGLGDITLLANYLLFHSRSQGGSKATVEQQLWIGGGLKLPTGNFTVDPNDASTTIADINAQIGTGSTDLLLNAMYTIRINRIGINSSLNYKIGTNNHAEYKFGNRLSSNTIAYYQIQKKSFSILPNLGIAYENTQKNLLKKEAVAFTGSYSVGAIAGAELSFNSGMSVGFNVQLPVQQSYAEGQTKMQIRGMAHVTFSL